MAGVCWFVLGLDVADYHRACLVLVLVSGGSVLEEEAGVGVLAVEDGELGP